MKSRLFQTKGLPTAACAIYAQLHGTLRDSPPRLPRLAARQQNPPMHLQPYQSVDGTPFTATREDIIRAHGPPHSEERNNVGLTALEFLVAFLQAFVFAVLACIYLNDVVNLGSHH